MSSGVPHSHSAGPRAQPLYFGPADASLFGWYHAPAGPSRDIGVVISAPFGVEAVFAHRALRHIAERLAADGFAVLRYDHAGTGDSQGTGLEPGRIATWTSGVSTAKETVRRISGSSRVALIGMRFGATLGAIAAARDGGFDALVLWAPISDGKQYARELRAFARMGGSPTGGGAGGFALEADTLSAMGELDLLSMETRPAEHVLVIPRDDLPDDGAAAARLAVIGCSVSTANAAGYAGAVTEPHNTQVPSLVIDAMVAWMRDIAGPASSSRGEIGTLRDTMTTDEARGASGAPAPVRERAVFLDDARRLFGVLTEPEASHRGTTIVLVNAGAVSRVGPNRLYVSMARDWAARGFSVLRMDIGGIGDSLPASGLAENDTYPATAVSDVVAAIDALRRRGARRFVVAGLCSGAHTAFHLGADGAPVEGLAGLVLMNPIVFYWKPGDALDVGAWQNYAAAQWYKRRARSPEAWLRVATGKVKLGEIVATFARRATAIARAEAARFTRRVSGGGREDLARDLTALVQRQLSLFLAFSDGDPGLDQLRLHAGHALRRLGRRPNFRLVTFDGADHTFTQLDAQQRVRAALAEHLSATFD